MYTFKNTEINNKKASDFETKSMLYLLGMRSDSDEIDLIAVDCFNDVTGVNQDFSKLWDVQSKNHSNLPPSKIGESLVTLYNNFISSISFFDYIIFIPKLKRCYLIDSSLNIYGYQNIQHKHRVGIEKKLKQKINKNETGDVPTLFCEFLDKVTFVEDNKKTSTYIKNISRFKNKRDVSEEVYTRIFNEIRNVQASLKISYIENEVITQPDEIMKFGRHITKLQINTMLINRLVGIDIFASAAIPLPFIEYIIGMEQEEVKDLIQECNENLSRAFFDKNGCREFWKISENIIKLVKINPKQTVSSIYNELISKVKIKTQYLPERTIQYMISLIKTGLDNAS